MLLTSFRPVETVSGNYAVGLQSAERRRVLVVDDDPSLCDLIGDVFHTFAEGRFELTCVNSDAAAYRALAGEPPYDSILVDINLGRGTTGYDVARRARSIRPDVRIIYISGQIDKISVATFGVPGGTFLPKPFTPEQLFMAMGSESHPESG